MWTDALYESWFDVYGQPMIPGVGPYFSPTQRADIRRRLMSGGAVSITERNAARSGQLGPDVQAAHDARYGDVQTVPGMTITATSGSAVLLMVAWWLLSRKRI